MIGVEKRQDLNASVALFALQCSLQRVNFAMSICR